MASTRKKKSTPAPPARKQRANAKKPSPRPSSRQPRKDRKIVSSRTRAKRSKPQRGSASSRSAKAKGKRTHKVSLIKRTRLRGDRKQKRAGVVKKKAGGEPASASAAPQAPPAVALIVVAGMRHSGSTALFNILRLGFARAGARILSGYSEHKQTAEILVRNDALRLIKTHEFRDDIAAAANLVFTARRDLRDSVASAVRRDFPLYRQLRTPVEYAKHNRALHAIWAPHSDFEFVYERFMADPVAVTGDILEAAGLSRIAAADICRDVLQLPTDDYDTTLLTPQHITDPTHKLSFGDTLALHDVKTIEAHHYKWLRRHGYARGSEKEE
jgi:hypothetical protein